MRIFPSFSHRLSTARPTSTFSLSRACRSVASSATSSSVGNRIGFRLSFSSSTSAAFSLLAYAGSAAPGGADAAVTKQGGGNLVLERLAMRLGNGHQLRVDERGFRVEGPTYTAGFAAEITLPDGTTKPTGYSVAFPGDRLNLLAGYRFLCCSFMTGERLPDRLLRSGPSTSYQGIKFMTDTLPIAGPGTTFELCQFAPPQQVAAGATLIDFDEPSLGTWDDWTRVR